MLHQMVTDEKEAAVREAAVRSMAVVLVHGDDDDKFPQVSYTSRCLQSAGLTHDAWCDLL